MKIHTIKEEEKNEFCQQQSQNMTICQTCLHLSQSALAAMEE